MTKSYSNSKKEGRDIVLIIDSSDSMRQRGFDPTDLWRNKFDIVKEVVGDFIEKRENDRIGMVTFAIVGNLWLAVYILHTRFFVIFVFCNSILIQNMYFKEFIKSKKKLIVFFIILILFQGVFYCLRTLAYG